MQGPSWEWMKKILWIQILIVVWLMFTAAAHAIQLALGDIAHIQGLRENQIIGYGLVVGLQGSGDSRASLVTAHSMANMLEKFGLNLSQRDFSARNSAAVMVTATLSPFIREGDKLDVNVASVGDAKSLQGGTLLLTPLYAGNQKVYAYAQGALSVGGYYIASKSQAIMKNITTVGIIPNGGIVEKAVNSEFLIENTFNFSLAETDFVLANKVVISLVEKFGLGVARTINGTNIEITIPERYRANPVSFIAEAMAVKVEHQGKSKVVIDERTGTVVVGGDIRISKVAVSHGGLHIAIAGETTVSQPLPFTLGETVVSEQLSLRADEAKKEMVVMPEGTTIEELVRALNAINTLPRDIIVILENIKAIGALHAQIVAR